MPNHATILQTEEDRHQSTSTREDYKGCQQVSEVKTESKEEFAPIQMDSVPFHLHRIDIKHSFEDTSWTRDKLVCDPEYRAYLKEVEKNSKSEQNETSEDNDEEVAIPTGQLGLLDVKLLRQMRGCLIAVVMLMEPAEKEKENFGAYERRDSRATPSGNKQANVAVLKTTSRSSKFTTIQNQGPDDNLDFDWPKR